MTTDGAIRAAAARAVKAIALRDAHCDPGAWWDEWGFAWRQIGWHAQIDLRMNQRDLRHRMPWGEWVTCERCHVRQRQRRCKNCARDLCDLCMPSACPSAKEGHV